MRSQACYVSCVGLFTWLGWVARVGLGGKRALLSVPFVCDAVILLSQMFTAYLPCACAGVGGLQVPG